jgi:Uma2 family endonuclease
MSAIESPREKWIGADSAGVRMTPEEFDSFEEGEWDELYRYELVNGVLVVRELESDEICDLNQRLGNEFWLWMRNEDRAHEQFRTLPNRYLYLKRSRRLVHRMIWTGIHGRPKSTDIPAIAVDFLSPGTRYWKRDYEARCDEYLSAGVGEYCVVDCVDRTMTVSRQCGGRCQTEVIVENGAYRTSELPGFELPLKDWFAELDGWKRAQE